MRYFSADRIFTNLGPPLSDHVVITEDSGTISKIVKREKVSADIQHVRGAIVPGFVNTHCHLELSHLKNKLDTGTGLIPFIRSVVTLRDFPQEEILDAIQSADQEMYNNGIVAVGDISNKSDTAKTKSESSINYYTFVEMFDFLQDDEAENIFKNYLKVYHAQSEGKGNKKSCVPHSPYSVSKRLFQLLDTKNTSDQTISIHNQETWHENAFFLSKEGELLDFYEGFGIDISDFQPSGKNSIYYALDRMNSKCKTLFIHNTMTDAEDISNAHAWNDKCYWVTCPNANLYIENKFPNYQKFLDQNAKVAIGTDSLSSNWQLSILEELKTIEKYQSYVNTETLVKWSSFHGAEALGYEELGKIEEGRNPGLVALETNNVEEFSFNDVSSCYRLV